MVHCSLGPGRTSTAVRHRTIEEFWYFIQGNGEVWRMPAGEPIGGVTLVRPGTSLDIPVRTHFQFRNTGTVALRFIILTMPSWPGEEEAVLVEGFW